MYMVTEKVKIIQEAQEIKNHTAGRKYNIVKAI
jgi:hypothetical protein